jgi:transketolase
MDQNNFFNKNNFKMWSKLGMRASFGIIAQEIGKREKDLIILTADVSTSAGLDRFKKSFPDKYLDVGIAEQNLIGIATGLSSEGFNVITTTFAPFQSMRCCEQIKVNLGYMNQKVCMVGLASGLVLGNLGYTHCCIEDIGVLRSIPNITIISPADSAELAKALFASISHKNSVYLRLTGGSGINQIYEDDYNFEIGKAITLKKGDDLTIIANGQMVNEALVVSKKLEEKNIESEVINMHTVKPIDEEKIFECAKKNKLIISIEEHNLYGGLSSAISESLAKIQNSPKMIAFGINDRYTKGGDYDFLKKKFKLDADTIVDEILPIIEKSKK